MPLQSGDQFTQGMTVINLIDISFDGDYRIERYSLTTSLRLLDGAIFFFKDKELARESYNSFMQDATLAGWFDLLREFHLKQELGIIEWRAYATQGQPIGNLNAVAQVTIR